MTISHRFRFRGAAFLLAALVAVPVLAVDGGGGLVGWVENTHGVPIAGAVISIFGKGIRGGTLVTLSDSNGQFTLPSLPAGSYTLRALDNGHLPSPPRRVTVVPDRDSLFTVNLTPVGETPQSAPAAAPGDAEPVDPREARWLMRHKRRSVLEERGDQQPEEAEPDPATVALHEGGAPGLPEVAGKVELMASAAPFGAEGASPGIDSVPASLGIVRLNGRLSDTGRWSVGGLVSDSENTFWRMAAEFSVEPATGNQLQVGTGYGSGYLQPPSGGDSAGRMEGSGAIFVQDRWQVSPRLVALVGARYSYVGFLEDQNHIDPQATVEYRRHRMVFRGTMASRTIVPGGDLLALSAASTAPALSFARLDAGLRPERLMHLEVSFDRALGPTTLGARAFQEDVQDQLVNVFEDPNIARSLRILNAGPTTTRGMGVTFSGHLGEVMNGSVTYTYGRSWRDDPAAAEAVFGPASALSYREADFHDVIARVETFFDGTDTRLVAFYRLNSLEPDAEGHSTLTNTKRMCFDIQLSQGLPFLQSLTRADWELLLAVRNLFYDTSEGGTLDEVAVVHPPKRVLGGISVRF